jgi:uncharacterized protein YndB with AHSA1/START domain
MRWNKRSSQKKRSPRQPRSKTIQLKLSKLLPASCEDAFDLWLDEAQLHLWMRPSDAEFVDVEWHPTVGNTFRLELRESDGRLFTHSGRFVEIQRPRILRMTWNSTVLGDHPSQVSVEFTQKAGNCVVVLIHDLPDDEAILSDHQSGWLVILQRFVETLDAQMA